MDLGHLSEGQVPSRLETATLIQRVVAYGAITQGGISWGERPIRLKFELSPSGFHPLNLRRRRRPLFFGLPFFSCERKVSRGDWI